MQKLLIISFVEWAGAFQRPQHLAMGFARRGWDVTYVSPGYAHRRGARFASGLELPANLKVLEPLALPGARRLGAIAALNERSIARAVARAAPVGGWDAVAFNDPRWARVAARAPARARVFDAMDDLSSLAHSAAWAERMEREAIAAADRIWTGTAMMEERLRSRHPRVKFIACGVEGERFASPKREDAERARGEIERAFTAAGAPAAPLAGYFGHLNDRVDVALIEGLLAERWRVLLIGPSSSTMAPLPQSTSLLWVGPKPYAELPAHLACMDLALIPYRTDGPNRFLYPVKALEYLAGGKPVLSTPLPDVERFLKDFVLLGASPEDWRRVAREWDSIRADAAARAARGQVYACARSWDAMAGEMELELREQLGEPA